MDSNANVRRDVPLWNETRWNGCWNPDDGVGLYLHGGRFRKDLDMWWAQTVAFLPEAQLAVDRSWGRNATTDGIRFGNYELTITEEGWTSRFDGVGELTTIADLSLGPRGSAEPMVSVQWEMTALAAAPQWNLYERAETEKLDFAGDTHVQGGYHTTGYLRVDGVEYRLDGTGFKDHSSGARDWGRWDHHAFMLAVMPAWTLHAVMIAPGDGRAPTHIGVLYRDGQKIPVERFEIPKLVGMEVPGPMDLVVTTGTGETLRLVAEQVHGLPMTMTPDNNYINGINWDGAGDPVALIEGISRLTTADGTVGYVHLERSALCSALKRAG
jgi:hypothetical protein